jgi:hypothetical protein
MPRPPAVSYTVGRSSGHLVLVVVLVCAAVAATVLLAQSATPPLTKWVARSILTLSALLALAGWWRSGIGVLRWDGQGWLWTGFGDIAVHHNALVLDFQQLILLKLVSEDGAIAWLWLQGANGNRQWLALRRAIVAASHRTPQQSHDSPAPEGDRL